MEILDLHEDHTPDIVSDYSIVGSSDSQKWEEFHLKKLLPKWHFLENTGKKDRFWKDLDKAILK